MSSMTLWKKWKSSIVHEKKRLEFWKFSFSLKRCVTKGKCVTLGMSKMCHFRYVKNVSLRVCLLYFKAWNPSGPKVQTIPMRIILFNFSFLHISNQNKNNKNFFLSNFYQTWHNILNGAHKQELNNSGLIMGRETWFYCCLSFSWSETWLLVIFFQFQSVQFNQVVAYWFSFLMN